MKSDSLSGIEGEATTRQSRKRLVSLSFFAFAMMFPGTLSAPVLREFVQEIYTIGPDGAAWFLSVGMFGSILAAPLVGWYCDRSSDRYHFILAGALVNAACWAVLPYAPGFEAALGIRLLEGASSVCIIGPLLAFAGDRNLNSANHRTNDSVQSGVDSSMIYGWVGMLMMLGAGIGLVVGGIVGAWNAYAPFALASICMLGNAVFARVFLRRLDQNSVVDTGDVVRSNSVSEPRAAQAGLNESMLAILRLGLGGALLLTLPLALTFVDRFSVGYLMTSFNFRMREDLAMNAAAAGGVLGLVMILMSLLSPAAAGFVRRGRDTVVTCVKAVAVGSILYGVGIIFTGVVTRPELVAGAAIIAGLGAGLMHAPTIILTSRIAPPGFRATAMSAYVAAGSLGNLCGPMVSRHLEVLLLDFAGPSGFVLLAASFGGLEILLALILLCAILFARSSFEATAVATP